MDGQTEDKWSEMYTLVLSPDEIKKKSFTTDSEYYQIDV